VSAQTISSGDGYVEFTASGTSTDRIAGLRNAANNYDYLDRDAKTGHLINGKLPTSRPQKKKKP
jgi:hypothetical protein